MTKKLFAIVALIIAIAAVTSCRMNVLKGKGNKTTKIPATASFDAVDIDIDLKTTVNVQAGSVPKVEIAGYENLLEHVLAKVENNKLRIYDDLDETWTIESKEVEVTITVPTISLLKLSGAPDAVVHGNMTGPAFKLDISGASSVKIDNLNVDNFTVNVSGAADVDVKGGNVKTATYEINGAGNVKAYPLQSAEATASISGAGTCHLTALQKLTSEISGAGTIKYQGHPAITKEVSGVGTISDAN